MTAADVAARDMTDERTAIWQSRAFGLQLEFDFAAPAFPRSDDARPEDVTRLRLASSDEIDARWPADGQRVLGEMWQADGSLDMRVEQHPSAGYRLTLAGTGLYLVSADGRSILCAPPKEPVWRWQRGLVGQVIPLASALQGFEVLHASALDVAGRCVLLEGPPGAGKSSLALELVRGGATILAEDVAAVRVHEGRVEVQPGVAMVNLRSDQAARLAAAMPRGGQVIGRSDKTHVLLPRAESPMPLDRFYVLDRAARDGGPRIVASRSPTPAELIGSTFVPYLDTVESMMLRLEVASHIAQSVSVFHVAVDTSTGVERLADELRDHVSTPVS